MKIYNQSVFEPWPFEDRSIQAVITSPPYWSQRLYSIPDITFKRGGTEHLTCSCIPDSDGICKICGNWSGQYGLEPNYKDYIEHTLLWAEEAYRVLRDDGIFFLNLGDSFSGSSRGASKGKKATENKLGLSSELLPENKFDCGNVSQKSKMLIPHRIAIALVDKGWILRNDIVWYKSNSMPESTADRFSKKFEYIFMFTKNPKYFFNLDAIRVPSKDPTDNLRRVLKHKQYNSKLKNAGVKDFHSKNIEEIKKRIFKGKNPGDMWSIHAQPSHEKHFATWPENLVRRMILCSSRPGDKILDPFCGSGTTVKVSEQLNREGIGIDLGYQDIQKKKCRNIQKELSYENLRNNK